MPGYTILQPQRHLNDVDPDTGEIVPGWQVRARDTDTGTIVPVFVPDRVYSADNVKIAVERALEQVRAVHSLGAAE
jgi:hypothetical protein